MHIAHVAPEMAPFVKVGGLGDVVGALPRAQARAGREVTVVIPGYRSVWNRLPRTLASQPIAYRVAGVEVRGAAIETRLDGVRLIVIAHDEFFARDGVYGTSDGSYGDNGVRFAWFCGAALEALRRLPAPPQAIVAHDWPAALATTLLRAHPRVLDPLKDTASLLVIHNLAHQGVFPMDLARWMEIPEIFIDHHGLESLGALNLLKGAIYHATAVVTVSPTYAKEIVWPLFGEGLEGALQSRGDDLSGILNGIDVDAWNPMTDRALDARYGPEAPVGKALCKAALQKELGLRVEDTVPVFGMVTRVDRQKGIHLVEHVAPWLVEQGAQIVLLGTGQRSLIEPLHGLASIWRQSVAIVEAFDERLARRIYAGSDFFVMPSIFEPCGLGQMVALRYGTPPIVRRTGGLADTVRDIDESPANGNGYVFNHPDPEGLRWACERALRTFTRAPGDLALMRVRAMGEDLSWEKSAAAYDRLIERAALREKSRILAV